MLFDQIYLTDFRGVRRVLPLDLTAPVTVLYAPNGTGKTTVCDAAEWLLLGDVERLTETAKPDIRNWFADPTTSARRPVAARISVAGEAHTIARSEQGALETRQSPRDPWQLLDQAAFHRTLVGYDLATASKQQRVAEQRAWIRAARFFDGQDLQDLVDPSKDGRDLRRIAFSSLFGVGRQQDRERLTWILEKMTGTWVRAGVPEVARLVAAREQSVAQSGDEFVDLQTALSDRLARAESELGLQRADGVQLGRVEVLRLSVAEAQAAAGTLIAALKLVREGFAASSESRATRERLKARLRAIELERVEVLKDCLSHETARNLAAGEEGALRTRIAGLTARRDALLALQSDLSAILAADPSLDSLPILDAIAVESAAGARAVAAAVERVALWAYCQGQASQWARTAVDAVANSELAAELQKAVDSQPKGIEAELELAQARVQSASTGLARLNALAATFRAEVVKFSSAMPDDASCPVCGVEHSDVASLKDAIQRRLNAEPRALVALARDLQDAAEAESRLEAALGAARTNAHRLRMVRSEVEAANANVALAAQRLRMLGLPTDVILKPELADILASGAADARTELSRLKAKSDELSRRAEQARELARLADAAADLTAGEAAGLTNEPLRSWASRLGTWVSATELSRAQAERSAREASAVRQSAATRLVAAGEAAEVLRAEGAEVQKGINALDAQAREFDRAVEAAGLAGDVDGSKVESATARALDRERLIGDLAQRLPALSSEVQHYLRQVADKSELGKLRAQLTAAEALSSVRRRWRDEIVEAIACIDRERDAAVQSQIGPLQETIRAIFARAQAHAVIDRVDVIPAPGGGLEWALNIGSHRETDPRALSRGQRQDLALSVFLARAVGLGGTVFMDEPLLHLDDLNRVGLLDTLRVVAQEHGERMRVVLTTADRMLVRHFREKFDLLVGRNRSPLLNIVTLSGGPQSQVTAEVERVARKPEFDELSLVPSTPSAAGT